MSANCTAAQLQALTDFGYHVGLAFQIIDDILTSPRPASSSGNRRQGHRAQKATYPRSSAWRSPEDCGAIDGPGVRRLEDF